MTNYNERLDEILDDLVEGCEDGRNTLGYRYDLGSKAKQALRTLFQEAMDEVIGGDVMSEFCGAVIPHGKSVQIDMLNNTAESCKFIEANGKFIIQQEQRQRAKEILTEMFGD